MDVDVDVDANVDVRTEKSEDDLVGDGATGQVDQMDAGSSAGGREAG